MQSWAAAWGINGLIFVGFIYIFAFACQKDKRILHVMAVIFLALAMWGTMPTTGGS